MTKARRYWMGGTIAALLALSLPALAQQAEVPDATLTPGVIASTNEAEVCGVVGGLSYSKRHRQTPAGLKALVFRRYGIDPRGQDWEIDHRLPLALGGADAVYNLFPQPGDGHGARFTYHHKDKLEVWAWEQVCRRHAMPLAEAQAIFMAPDWRPAYCEKIKGPPC
jgi:hypothetical protein